MFEAPLTFAEAEAMLTARLDTPTALRHKEIAALWDDEFRSRAFFSARVTEATVLSELHRRAQDVLDGKMTGKQAVELLRDYFVGPGADALAAMGFAPKRDARTIGELASLPRLQLIIETNVRMAQECGHYQQWAESAVYWRYGIWRCGYAEEHREEHLARDGRAYAFEHPIWTQSPPGGEFNCHCWREIASEDDIRELGIEPEPLSSPFQPSSLGFDPSRGMAEPPPFGKRVRPEYREKAAGKINAFIAGKGSGQARPSLPTEESKSQPGSPATPKPSHPRIVNRFAGHGNFVNNVTNPTIKEAVDIAQKAIAEITDAEFPPFNSVHRLMTSLEVKGQAEGVLGFHQRIDSKGGVAWHDIAIKPFCPYPIITDIHGMVHAYIDAGTIRKKEVKKIFKLIKSTATYKNSETEMQGTYGESNVAEWVTRAVTWSWVVRSADEKIIKESICIANDPNYSESVVWKGFGRRSATDNKADLKLEGEIMKLTPKTLFGKLKRKLGFSDALPENIPDPTKPGDPGYDTIKVFLGLTRKELDYYCPKFTGMTADEYLASVERVQEQIASKKPGEGQIPLM